MDDERFFWGIFYAVLLSLPFWLWLANWVAS
jgi:hypothetical protein